MATGIKLNNKTIIGTSSELSLVRRKWLTDGIFRNSAVKLMVYRDLISPQDVYRAQELLDLMRSGHEIEYTA